MRLSALFAEGVEVKDIRKEIIILRQQLSDRDETIVQLQKENEASEATIKMLKEKVHRLSDQLSSSGVVKREHADIRGEVRLHPIKRGIVNIHAFTI